MEISKTKKIIEDLEKQNKVEIIEYDFSEMNKEMEEVRRIYKIKAARSWDGAVRRLF